MFEEYSDIAGERLASMGEIEDESQEHEENFDLPHFGDSDQKIGATCTGRSIGQFVLHKTLGQGTFGKVKLATHIPTGEKVAIKILEKVKLLDEAEKTRVDREIKILKSLRHENIVQIYSVIETPSKIYLVMEFAGGGELFDYIVLKEKLSEAEAMHFFSQFLDGIDYMHSKGVVHRDLKPENLLLDFKKKIKIVDFGLSNLYTNNQLLETPCGSPCYAAPEMILNLKYKPVKVDIWSSGVILYAMVCGCLPFDEKDNDVLYSNITLGKYTIPKFVSPQLRDLLKCILNTDPAKRYDVKQIKKHIWMRGGAIISKLGSVQTNFQLNQKNSNFNKKNLPLNTINVQFNKTKISNNFGSSVNSNSLLNSKVGSYDKMSTRKLKKDDDYIKKKVFSQMLILGHDKETILDSVDNNRHNNLTTTYYLLVKKFMRIENEKLNETSSSTIPKNNSDNKFDKPENDILNASQLSFKNYSGRGVGSGYLETENNYQPIATELGQSRSSIRHQNKGISEEDKINEEDYENFFKTDVDDVQEKSFEGSFYNPLNEKRANFISSKKNNSLIKLRLKQQYKNYFKISPGTGNKIKRGFFDTSASFEKTQELKNRTFTEMRETSSAKKHKSTSKSPDIEKLFSGISKKVKKSFNFGGPKLKNNFNIIKNPVDLSSTKKNFQNKDVLIIKSHRNTENAEINLRSTSEPSRKEKIIIPKIKVPKFENSLFTNKANNKNISINSQTRKLPETTATKTFIATPDKIPPKNYINYNNKPPALFHQKHKKNLKPPIVPINMISNSIYNKEKTNGTLSQSSSNKKSSSSLKSYKSGVEDLETHEGPIDMHLVFNKSLQKLRDDLIKIFSLLNISYNQIKNNKYKFICCKIETSFVLQILRLPYNPDLYYLKINTTINKDKKFEDICKKIIFAFNL